MSEKILDGYLIFSSGQWMINIPEGVKGQKCRIEKSTKDLIKFCNKNKIKISNKDCLIDQYSRQLEY